MRLFLIVVWMLITGFSVMAQTKADRLFERGDYLAALKLYKDQLESAGDTKDGKSDPLKMRVANCFYRLNDMLRAGQMYKSVNPDLLSAEDMSFFAMTLLRSGEYDKALELIEMVESLGGDPEIVSQVQSSCEFAKEVAKEKPLYAANKTNVNFAGFSSGVTYYKGKSIILAAPGMGEGTATDSRGYKVTRLYNAVFTGDGAGGRMLPFADGLVDKYHTGAVTFTKDFKRIYYTRTILKKDGTSILKLMTAEEVNGKWENVAELNINSDDYSCAHPTLFRDSLLFFVSDMPDGIGGKDIYVTSVQGAECGDIQNLGEKVNTSSDELFPFIDDSGALYFASNGHVGLGGLDVFVSRQDAGGNWNEPQNMGRPVNSSMDDFGLVFKDTKCVEGYVSSNRGGTGYNDFLFSLKLLPNQVSKDGKSKPKVIRRGTDLAQGDEAEHGDVFSGKESPVLVSKQEMFTVDYRYAIQVGAFRNPVPRVYFENLKNVKVYLGYDNIYRYTVGEYPDEQLAQSDLSQVRGQISDAFMISTDKYVAQKKIQNGIGGDKITDDELLLIRLKNFERLKKAHNLPDGTPSGRRLERPRTNELRGSESDVYTIVLMSADRVLDLTQFNGIDEIDVYSMPGGKYMYCTGLYADTYSASSYLSAVRQKGFASARIEKTDFQRRGVNASALTQTTLFAPSRSESPGRTVRTDLKNTLNF